MIISKQNSLASQEETKCPFSSPQHAYPSLSQSTIIELSINEDTYFISKDNPLFEILHALLRYIPSVIIVKNTILSIAIPNTLEVTKEILEVYFQCLTSSSIPSLDFALTSRLVSLCLFFYDKETLKKIIQSNINPIIDKYTSVDIIYHYYPYLTNECFSDLFIEVVTKAIFIVCANMFFIISNRRDSLVRLDDEAFERIISTYFQKVLFNPNIDHSLLMSLLMTKRDINDVFELLENERKDSINKFEELLVNQMDPSLEWTIQLEDPSDGLYIESEEFAFESITNQIIAYYDHKKDMFNIALKIIHIKADSNNDEDDITFSQPQRYNNCNAKDNENASNRNINININSQSNQFIISLLSLCEIPELEFKLKLNFNCIFSNTQTKILISRIENFKEKFRERNLEFANGSMFTLRLFFNISYNFSSILTHICKNFYQYHSLSSIKIIPKNVLNIILRNEELSIQSEDEMLIAVLNWLNCRNSKSSELLLEIAKNMNWGLISVDGLFEFFQSQGKLMISNKELQDLIVKEINSRFKKENYIEGDNSLDEAKIKIKRKYIPTSRYGSKKSFTSELLANILKRLPKNGGISNSDNNPQTQSNMSNTITAIYQHDDYYYTNNKKISMNSSGQELTNACSIKNSMRNAKGSSSKRYEKHNSMKANSTNWQNLIVSMPVTNIENSQYYKREGLKQSNNASSPYNNRNKLISTIQSNKSDFNYRESNIHSKAAYKLQKEDRCPNYIKNANNSIGMFNSQGSQIKQTKNNIPMNKKRKSTSIIKMAKIASRENLKKQLKRSQSNLNVSAQNKDSNNHVKVINKTRSFFN